MKNNNKRSLLNIDDSYILDDDTLHEDTSQSVDMSDSTIIQNIPCIEVNNNKKYSNCKNSLMTDLNNQNLYIKTNKKNNKMCETSPESESVQDNTNSPFILKDNIIKYNLDCGVKLKTNVLFGSKSMEGVNNKNGYRSVHLIYNATIGSLAFGYNSNNHWKNMANYSLITGYGNMTTNNASLISGMNNKIINTNFNSIQDIDISTLSNCSIMGNNNTITDCNSCSIIASSNSTISNSSNTIILGINQTDVDKALINLKEATITKNLYALNKLNIGAISTTVSSQSLNVNGDAGINGDLIVSGSILAKTIKAEEINACILDAEHISVYDTYVEAKTTSQIFNLLPEDKTNIIYCNPINGDVNINFGDEDYYDFQVNRSITIKDVSIATNYYNNAYNIYIRAQTPMVIETYNNNQLTALPNRGYIINTAGGSVTFTFFKDTQCWVITTQFIGNTRLTTTTIGGGINLPNPKPPPPCPPCPPCPDPNPKPTPKTKSLLLSRRKL
jgi:hypothetical protein